MCIFPMGRLGVGPDLKWKRVHWTGLDRRREIFYRQDLNQRRGAETRNITDQLQNRKYYKSEMPCNCKRGDSLWNCKVPPQWQEYIQNAAKTILFFQKGVLSCLWAYYTIVPRCMETCCNFNIINDVTHIFQLYNRVFAGSESRTISDQMIHCWERAACKHSRKYPLKTYYKLYTFCNF